MSETLNSNFLKSIVNIDNFSIDKNSAKIILVTINENLKDEIKILNIEDIIYINYSRWYNEMEIDVIDTFYEPFNICNLVKSMHSPEFDKYSIIRFHSGEHHLIFGASRIYF
jgi:hypothetical protein